MKEIIRDIKIDLLMGNENPILERFREITDGMMVINCDVYNKDGQEFIYFNKEREWIFYQDAKNKFWCEHDRYWKIFDGLKMEYSEIQALTKFLVEEVLMREIEATPTYSFSTFRGYLNLELEEYKRVAMPVRAMPRLSGHKRCQNH